MTSHSLVYSILNALQSYPQNILLEDDYSQWSGLQLRTHLFSLIDLIEKQSAPQSRVGVCFYNSVPQAIAILSILLANRVPVILNGVDLLEGRIDWIRHSKCNFVLVSDDLKMKVNCNYLSLDESGLISEFKEVVKGGINLSQLLYTPPVGTSLILFTSGSTGEPKEVYLPEIGILKTIKYLIETFNLNQKSIASVTLPICHSMALNTQFLPTVLVGGKCRFYNLRLSMNKVYRGFLRDRSTFVSLIGEIIRTSWEERKLKNLPPCDHVEHIQLAGGLISTKHLEMARELFPKAQIHKGYGLTEAIRVSMISSNDKKFQTTAVGKPLPFLKIKIRNEQGVEQAPGQMGEIYVKGDSVMLGTRSLTSSVCKSIEGADYLPTGDFGMLDEEGYLHVTGRLDSLFKINGKRVSGIEIEKTALEASEKFRFAKAVLVEDEVRHRPRVVLFIELDRSCWFNEKVALDPSVQDRLSQRVKSLIVPPKEIVFVQNFPRTSNGKLNLPRLKEIWNIQGAKPLNQSSQSNLNLYSIENEVSA